MMTTMAALLGAVPLAMGTGIGFGAAAAAGHHDHRRIDLQPGAHALHHAGHLSGVRPAGEAAMRAGRVERSCRAGTPRPLRSGGAAMSLVHARSSIGRSATTLLTVAVMLAGALGLFPAAGVAAAAGRFSDHLGLGARCRAPAPRRWPPRSPRRWSGSSAGSPASRK